MFDMLQLIIKNYKKILFILFLFFVCVAGYYFYFSKKDLIDKHFFAFNIGFISEINNEFLIISIDSQDPLQENKEKKKKYQIDKSTTVFRELNQVKSEKEFREEEIIFKNYLLSDVENKNNIEAPSWYKVEKIIYTDLKIGDNVKVYYDNEDMAVKIILLKKSFNNNDDQYIKLDSRQSLSVYGEILRIDKINKIIEIKKTDAFLEEDLVKKNIIKISNSTQFFKRRIKDNQEFLKEQEEFNKKNQEIKKLKQGIGPKKAPERFIVDGYSFDSLIVGDKILVNYGTTDDNKDINAEKIITDYLTKVLIEMLAC